ncbi:hypothetical protein SDC9_165119 [bioreactor metagenome]|uniref:Uncharacterized protein n=1 Tax=bioreactor metagenome TaxID=1076179 RepID=A0A645G0V8_9ZZZZ
MSVVSLFLSNSCLLSSSASLFIDNRSSLTSLILLLYSKVFLYFPSPITFAILDTFSIGFDIDLDINIDIIIVVPIDIALIISINLFMIFKNFISFSI